MEEKEKTEFSSIKVEPLNENKKPSLNKIDTLDFVNVELSKTKFFLVILALIISLIISSLDISIVATAY